MDKDYTLLRPRCRTGRSEIVSDIERIAIERADTIDAQAAVISLLSDDALATSFQTLGQYRAHLIGVLKAKAPDHT